jgi:hypothetical protein
LHWSALNVKLKFERKHANQIDMPEV